MMTTTTTTTAPLGPALLDAVDRAFLRRLTGSDAHRSPDAAAAAAALPAGTPGPTPAAAPRIRAGAAAAEPSCAADPLVERLLAAVPEAWIGLAQRVEAAHRGGRDGAVVIAVTGARRGEGRTTIVHCLARVLAARGRAVECVTAAPLEPGLLGGRRPPIVLVDAGVWFPAGPLRRGWIERQGLGCHAVILVRRADQPDCPARADACAAVGLDVLGEVVTMVPPAGGAGVALEEPTR